MSWWQGATENNTNTARNAQITASDQSLLHLRALSLCVEVWGLKVGWDKNFTHLIQIHSNHINRSTFDWVIEHFYNVVGLFTDKLQCFILFQNL